MDFADRIYSHAKRVSELKDITEREEAAKTALVMPFLQVLGYDSFDPRVVVPEYNAHFGKKKAEKVDYAIKRNDEIIMLVEAKAAKDSLDSACAKQLQLYFNALPSVKIAILTNGVVYKFFTDLESENIMDEKPFMVFDFMNIEEPLIPELKKLCNDCFDMEVALAAAQDLKYLSQIKKIIAAEIKNPTDELVKHFIKQVYTKVLWATVVESFREPVRLAFEHYVNDVINARLQGAMQSNSYDLIENSDELANDLEKINKKEPETTPEEWGGLYLVKALLCDTIDPNRIHMRDTIGYCGILLDNKNTKPICRLHFNSKTTKFLETFDAAKKGTKNQIEEISDINKYADLLKETVQNYDKITN